MYWSLHLTPGPHCKTYTVFDCLLAGHQRTKQPGKMETLLKAWQHVWQSSQAVLCSCPSLLMGIGPLLLTSCCSNTPPNLQWLYMLMSDCKLARQQQRGAVTSSRADSSETLPAASQNSTVSDTMAASVFREEGSLMQLSLGENAKKPG